MVITAGSPAITTPYKPLQSATQTAGITIGIKPGAENVAAGDRSSNTIDVSITTPNREASTEISREQAVDRVERQLQTNTLNQLTENNISPRAIRALQNSDIDSGGIYELATVRNQKQLAETYANVSNQNNSQNNTTESSQPTTGTGLYNNTVDAYIKHTLFFSTVDSVKSTFSTTA